LDYRTRYLDRIIEVPASAWDSLLPEHPAAGLVSHGMLAAFEEADCLGPQTGWEVHHWTLWDAEDNLVAAMPLYRKWHSYGEYVFDWAWANAYARHGFDYYPKWLSALPFTPISGPRLLRKHNDLMIMPRMLADLKALDGSSAHCLFSDGLNESDLKAMQEASWMRRTGVQFHWYQANYKDFEDFLNALSQSKRKKIRAERRKVNEQGIRFEHKTGADLHENDWAFFYACYERTYRMHGNAPYLTLAFFLRLHESQPERSVLFLGHDELGPCCASLLFRHKDRAFGRYWGAIRDYPFVHFEACYYQPIEWAIREGIQCIEGGAQGQHKMARGFDPAPTESWHWLRHPSFANAVEHFLSKEGLHMEHLLDELQEHRAFKSVR
jgi:predicted N-acyltransferase